MVIGHHGHGWWDTGALALGRSDMGARTRVLGHLGHGCSDNTVLGCSDMVLGSSGMCPRCSGARTLVLGPLGHGARTRCSGARACVRGARRGCSGMCPRCSTWVLGHVSEVLGHGCSGARAWCSRCSTLVPFCPSTFGRFCSAPRGSMLGTLGHPYASPKHTGAMVSSP